MNIAKWIMLPLMATLATAADVIGFFAVATTHNEGSQPVSVKSLGVDGFSTEKPGYSVTSVEQAFLLPPGPVTIIGQDGKPNGQRKNTTFDLSVRLPESEHKAFAEFTRQCVGGKILLKIGKEPILALTLFSAIDNGKFELTLDSKEKAEKLLTEFKKAQQGADGKTLKAPLPPP